MTRSTTAKAARKPLRAAIYVRLSEETEATTSPARQREISTRYATDRDWDVVGVFEDIDFSATKTGLDRPGLAKLRAAVARGEADVVIVWRLDRLARSVLDTLTLLKEWTDHGVAVASATEPVDLTTPLGKAMVALIAIFAEMEADAIKARVTSSIDALRRSDRFAGGTVPYGYRPAPAPDGPGRVLVVDAEEAAVLRRVAERVLAGETLYRVCLDLNAERVPAPRSDYRRKARAGEDVDGADRGSWWTQALKRTMVSDHLLGRQRHRGELLRDDSGLPRAVWPPILDSPTVYRLRELLDAPEGTQRRQRVRRARLLSGIAVCAHCERALYVRAWGSTTPVYTCSSKSAGRECVSQVATAERLEEHVLDVVRATLGETEMTETVADVEEPDATAAAEIEEAIRHTTAAMSADDADVPALLARLSSLKEARAEHRDRPAAVLYTVRKTGRTWSETFDAAETLVERQAMMADALKAVRVSKAGVPGGRFQPSRVEIVWTKDR